MYGVDTASRDDCARFLDRVAKKLAMNQARLRRLAEEIGEAGLVIDLTTEWGQIVITEVDYALRPHVHERRVPSVGTIIEPTTGADSGRSARSCS